MLSLSLVHCSGCPIVQYDCFNFPYFFIYTFLKYGRWFADDIITVFKMLNMISDSYYLSFFIIISCSFYFISRLLGFCNYFLNQFLIIHIFHNNLWSYPSRAMLSIIIDKKISHTILQIILIFFWYLAIFKNFWIVLFKLSTAPWHFGQHEGPNFWSIFCFSKNCLNSLLDNSPPLPYVSFTDYDVLINNFQCSNYSCWLFAHVYLEKWSIIVNKYLYGLVHNTLANCTKSIWHLSKGLELRMWWTISPFLSFSELTCHIWHLNQKFLTSP